MTKAIFLHILIFINKKVKINNEITAPELMVIDDGGQNLGNLSKEEALKLAQEKDLDLIEVSPFAKPPVARILDFDKYRYQQEKKIKKQQAQQKDRDIKQIQISVRSAKNDLLTKAKRANDFLTKGHPVRIVMVLKGREKAHKPFAKEKLINFLVEMITEHKITMEPKFAGRGIMVQIQKK